MILCPVTVGCTKKAISILLINPFEVLKGQNKVSQSLFQADQPQPSQPLLTRELFHSPIFLHAFLWMHFSRSRSFLCWRLWRQVQYFTWGHTGAHQRRRISSLGLLVRLYLMQPWIWLVFWAVRALMQSQTYWACVQLCIHQDPQVLLQSSSRRLSIPLPHKTVLKPVLVQPRKKPIS